MWKSLISILFVLVLGGCATEVEKIETHTATITISGKNEYKAVRLTPKIYNNIDGDISDLLIKDIEGEVIPYFIHTGKETDFIESIEPVFSVESEYKNTTIMIEDLKNLRLLDVTIHTDSMFKRNVHIADVNKELYNLTLSEELDADTTIDLGGYVSSKEVLKLVIDDGDDKPIKIDGVTVRYYADDVIFAGSLEKKSYTLEFGSDENKTAPKYDIVRYQDEILKGSVDKVTIADIQVVAAEEVVTPRDYQIVFNIVISAVALLLGVVIVLKIRKR